MRSSDADDGLVNNEVAEVDFRFVFLETKKTNECEHADRNSFFVKYHPLVNSIGSK